MPIIKKYIKPGSVIISDCWSDYVSLSEEGYTHYSVNHSEHFVDPHHPAVHTQNIERLWRDVKEWVKRPGIRSCYLRQYLARYLFLRQVGEQEIHCFFKEAAKLYPPLQTSQASSSPRPETSSSSSRAAAPPIPMAEDYDSDSDE